MTVLPAGDPAVAFQLHQRYLVRPVKNGIMVIRQEAAHERILYEDFLKKMKNHGGSTLQSLFPQTVNFSTADFTLVMEMEREIKALGFQFEVFGKNSLLVTGLPIEAAGKNEKELFEGLLEQFKHNQSALTVPLEDNLARSLAKRAAIKVGHVLTREEMELIIQRLFSCHNPNYSPDGDTTFFIFETSKIESHFR